MDIDDVRDLLRERARPTTDSSLARELGISPQYLSDVMLGRREPGPKLLRALGLSKEVRYVRVETLAALDRVIAHLKER